jgi:hypothetical protein
VLLIGGVAACFNRATSMSILIPLAFLSGALLGLKFKVFTLAPGIVLTAIAALAVGIAREESLSSTLVGELSSVIALQIGYVGGLLARCAASLARAAVHRKAPFQAESLR